MLALADMCIQYTALVDSHIQKLAGCLSDPNELVRKQALALLANLLSKVGGMKLSPLPTLHTFSLPKHALEAKNSNLLTQNSKSL